MIESAMDAVTHWVGNPLILPLGVLVIAGLYAVFGVDIANITISIVTFLLLPILQHSQNRDGIAIQTKLDELIRSSDARNEFIGLDRKSEKEIEHERFQE